MPHGVLGMAPQTPIPPLYPIGRQRCFWRPRMGVFGLHNAKIIFGFWGGTPNTIALYPIGQQRFFWMPGMVVFKVHNGKKNLLVLRWRPKHPYLCTLQASKVVLVYLRWKGWNCPIPKHILWGLGWRPKHTYHCTPLISKSVF